MAVPISTWALIAGLAASAAVVFGGPLFNPEVPPPLIWLGAWAALFSAQAASWTLSRKS